MKLISILFLSIIAALTTHAKTLVVTDIDDTLRVTNRVYGSYSEQLENILNLDMPFSGMKELMQVFDAQGAKIYYLTAAVKPLEKLGEAFLEHNDFPQKYRFIYKQWWQENEDYKVGEILRLIKKEKPDSIILIGDNGEKDSAAYARIQEIYPNSIIFIHYLYKHGTSVKVPPSQVAYVATAEVAAHLEHQGIILPDMSIYIMDVVSKDLKKSVFTQKLVLPSWSDIDSQDIEDFYKFPFILNDNSNDYLQLIMSDLTVLTSLN